MKKIDFKKEFPVLINKMLEGTGYTFDILMKNPIVNGDYWYSSLKWDEEKEQKYKRWFIDRMVNVHKMTKKTALKEWSWFNLMYGLRRSDV